MSDILELKSRVEAHADTLPDHLVPAAQMYLGAMCSLLFVVGEPAHSRFATRISALGLDPIDPLGVALVKMGHYGLQGTQLDISASQGIDRISKLGRYDDANNVIKWVIGLFDIQQSLFGVVQVEPLR